MFLRGVRIRPGWLKRHSTGAEGGTVVLYMNKLQTAGYLIKQTLMTKENFDNVWFNSIRMKMFSKITSCL
jgi:hypothetical protein